MTTQATVPGRGDWQTWFNPDGWSWQQLRPHVVDLDLDQPDRTLTGCVGKTRFGTYHNAEQAARRMSTRQGKRAGTRHRAKAYHCPNCGAYHVAKASKRGRIKTTRTRW